MSKLFPSGPKRLPPPAPPPTIADQPVQQAGQDVRQRAARAAARGATLLTGGMGVTELGNSVRQSSLLGG